MKYDSTISILLVFIYATALNVCSDMFPDKWSSISPVFVIVPVLFTLFLLYRFYKTDGVKIGRRKFIRMAVTITLLIFGLSAGMVYFFTGALF